MTSPSAASNDVFIFASVSGTSTQNFQLRGGVYLIALAAVSWGTVTLNVLAADAVTYVPFQTWSANAGATLTLVAGSYQLSYATLGVATLSLAQQPPSPDWRLESLTQPLPISGSGDITTVTLLPGTTELDLVGGAHGAWLFTPTDDSGGAGVGSGDVTSGGTGNAFLYTGGTSDAGTTGHIYIVTGNSVGGTTGEVLVASGDAGGGTRGRILLDGSMIAVTAPIQTNGGTLNIGTNNETGATPSQPAALYSGDTVTGTTGDVLVFSGDSSGGATNHVLIQSGNAGGGNSGNVALVTGTASGTRGSITMDALHVVIANLPTSASGLATGTLWNSTGTLKVA